MMWKIQQAMQDGAILAATIYPAFIPVNELKCSYGKISSPLPRPREPIQPSLSYEYIENFTKDLEVLDEISETRPAWSTGFV